MRNKKILLNERKNKKENDSQQHDTHEKRPRAQDYQKERVWQRKYICRNCRTWNELRQPKWRWNFCLTWYKCLVSWKIMMLEMTMVQQHKRVYAMWIWPRNVKLNEFDGVYTRCIPNAQVSKNLRTDCIIFERTPRPHRDIIYKSNEVAIKRACKV